MRAVVIAVSLLALAACKRSNASSGQPRVAFLLSTLQEERYTKDERFFEDAAQRRGLDPFTLSADNDNAHQLAREVAYAVRRGPRPRARSGSTT